MDWTLITFLIQIGLFALIGLLVYFRSRRVEPKREAKPKQNVQELQRLLQLRARKLSVPLCEMTRPVCFKEIIGQDEGIKALKAALCGPNPQHVLLFGPPGIGKTCAARLVLEEAKKQPGTEVQDPDEYLEEIKNKYRPDCRNMDLADSLFLLPKDVQFQDLSEALEQ